MENLKMLQVISQTDTGCRDCQYLGQYQDEFFPDKIHDLWFCDMGKTFVVLYVNIQDSDEAYNVTFYEDSKLQDITNTYQKIWENNVDWIACAFKRSQIKNLLPLSYKFR